jgi:cytoskeletal protein CcmA (bactofilin family)
MAVDTSGTTIIAKGTKLTGKLDIECKLHIDGEIEGSIHSANVVTVGSSGVLKGEVFAERLVVSGQMDGNADCNHIEVLAGGHVVGDIISTNLVIESQGVFEGYSKIRVSEGKGAPKAPLKETPKD